MIALAAVAFIRFVSYDFSTGNDFLTIDNTTQKKCEAQCAANSRCKGYVFNVNQKRCWLKDNFNGFRAVNNSEQVGIKVND